METLQQQLIFAGGALLCAIMASVHDVRKRRIPNYLTLPAIALGLIVHIITGGLRGLSDSTLAGLIAGGVFLIFYLAGGMGAGDVKLMTAVGCIAGLASLSTVLIATAIAGGIFALAVSIQHGRLRETLHNVGALLQHHGSRGLESHPALNLSNAETLRLPFVLPIAAGCLFTFCTLAWEAHS